MSATHWSDNVFRVSDCSRLEKSHDHQTIGGVIFCIEDERHSVQCWSDEHHACIQDGCVCTCHNPLRMTPVLHEVADILGIKFSE